MDSENKLNSDKQPEVGAETKTSEKRRKLIRGALIGAPVLLALKSTPVLACNCKLPSGFSTSGNLSRNGGATCTQPAHKPSYWKSHYSSTTKKFSNTNVTTTTLFNSVFSPTDPLNRNLLAVLQSGDSNFASLVVAAYLGLKSGYFVAGISETNIKQMWSGTYKPPGKTIPWNATECTDYLKYVMGVPL
jgi:hypothetical protein